MDAKRIGWIAVAIILVIDGVSTAWTGEIFGKVRMAETGPLLQGWYVHLIGVIEALFGATLIYRFMRRG